ncbi:MAG: pyridoxal-phosphate dependent enzyme [Acidobacteria bacterium]|nr:pyridoxal-phosphate dependent enzyme [Acidobacteriota bacterium]
MISFDRIQRAAQRINPVFLHSPQFVCEPLFHTLLKVETLNPIRCFKGRGAEWLLETLEVREPLVCASAGNFGQAMAYACRARGIPLTVYAAANANRLKVQRMTELGAEVVLTGEDFDAAKLAARASGGRFIEDALELATAEGAGTIGIELATASFDTLLVPLGNGALLGGVAAAIRALMPNVRIVGVQAAGAPAMTESLMHGKTITHPSISTIADGIGVRIPIPAALEYLDGAYDELHLVKEQTILKAMRLIHRYAGIVVEPSGAVGLAAMLEDPESFRGRRNAIILCGGNLTDAQIREWLA